PNWSADRLPAAVENKASVAALMRKDEAADQVWVRCEQVGREQCAAISSTAWWALRWGHCPRPLRRFAPHSPLFVEDCSCDCPFDGNAPDRPILLLSMRWLPEENSNF